MKPSTIMKRQDPTEEDNFKVTISVLIVLIVVGLVIFLALLLKMKANEDELRNMFFPTSVATRAQVTAPKAQVTPIPQPQAWTQARVALMRKLMTYSSAQITEQIQAVVKDAESVLLQVRHLKERRALFDAVYLPDATWYGVPVTDVLTCVTTLVDAWDVRHYAGERLYGARKEPEVTVKWLVGYVDVVAEMMIPYAYWEDVICHETQFSTGSLGEITRHYRLEFTEAGWRVAAVY